jgi:AraC family transcriptional regulator, transcriptional activator of pobA
MENPEFKIPFYAEINDLLQDIAPHLNSKNPNLFCLRSLPNHAAITTYKPPFKKGFYFISCITDAGITKLTYDTTNVTNLDSFFVFQAPSQVYSFKRASTANGFIIYFKKEIFDFFRPDFDATFPFFDLSHTNFFKINKAKFEEVRPHLQMIFDTYTEANASNNYQAVYALLLSLLFRFKEFTTAYNQWETGFSSPQQLLFKKFIQLVNNYYLEKRTVDEYATLLNVTPNHLSHTIKELTQRNALSHINDKIITEAKALIQFTKADIAEIAYQLNFSDPANFGKFFKKYEGCTPLEFRKNKG